MLVPVLEEGLEQAERHRSSRHARSVVAASSLVQELDSKQATHELSSAHAFACEQQSDLRQTLQKSLSVVRPQPALPLELAEDALELELAEDELDDDELDPPPHARGCVPLGSAVPGAATQV